MIGQGRCLVSWYCGRSALVSDLRTDWREMARCRLILRIDHPSTRNFFLMNSMSTILSTILSPCRQSYPPSVQGTPLKVVNFSVVTTPQSGQLLD